MQNCSRVATAGGRDRASLAVAWRGWQSEAWLPVRTKGRRRSRKPRSIGLSGDIGKGPASRVIAKLQ